MRHDAKQRGFENSIFPRLELAVYYGMKRFVSTTSCQVVLRRAWTGEWRTWNRTTISMLTLHVLFRILFMPLFVLLELLLPFSAWGRWNRSPVNKMLLFMASYLIFVCLIAVHIEESKVPYAFYEIRLTRVVFVSYQPIGFFFIIDKWDQNQ